MNLKNNDRYKHPLKRFKADGCLLLAAGFIAGIILVLLIQRRREPNSTTDRHDQKPALDSGASTVKVKAVSRLSAGDQMLLDVGKGVVEQSIQTGLDFHKTMLGLTATFTTLMATALGVSSVLLHFPARLAVIGPIAVMLASSVVFAFGYNPIPSRFSLDLVDEIETAYRRIIKRRQRFATVGTILFAIAIIWMILGILLLLP